MKKFFLIMAVAALSLQAYAGTDTEARISIYQEKQYKKIDVSEVSKEAMDKITKSYGNYTVKEAYRAADGEYKLVLTKDGTDLTATFTAAGDLIKIL